MLLENSPFNLPYNLTAKAVPALISRDEQHLVKIAASLSQAREELRSHLVASRQEQVKLGQAAVERDVEIRRLTGRLRTLDRFGLNLCLGRIDPSDGSAPLFIGRLGLSDKNGKQLLIDWRTPAAEPFFGATHVHPMGLASRRRYRWSRGLITDYWDESFNLERSPGPVESGAALEDLSAFIASLGVSRSPKMNDVLGTIAADQDAIVRASARGTLVVEGGPGTGKTVVALHRAAYLMYTDSRIGQHHGGVLFVGPHQPFLNYVADVLPGLGEDGVQTCTLRQLVPEDAGAAVEHDKRVAALKSTRDMVKAIDTAVAFYENPPQERMEVRTPYGELGLSVQDWAEAFAAPSPGTPHNEARAEVWEALVDILQDKDDAGDLPSGVFRRSLAQNQDLVDTFSRAWPLLNYNDVVGDLRRVPAYLCLCAPWLSRDEVALLQREMPDEWTDADVPLLDAARLRLGDPEESRRKVRRAAVEHAQQQLMDRVVEDLIAADDSELLVMSMLRGADMQEKLAGQDAVEEPAPDALLGPFAHIVVDEAQELSDAQWQMLLTRCPSRSFTVVGDRAQARQGFAESWEERMARIGLRNVSIARLGVNYRTPAEIMAVAEPVIREAIPDAAVPTSIRKSEQPVTYGSAADLGPLVEAWLAENAGTACIIAQDGTSGIGDSSRLRTLAPEQAKGLEFDLLVLLMPEMFGDGTGISRSVDTYVAMTRATQQLMVLR